MGPEGWHNGEYGRNFLILKNEKWHLKIYDSWVALAKISGREMKSACKDQWGGKVTQKCQDVQDLTHSLARASSTPEVGFQSPLPLRPSSNPPFPKTDNFRVLKRSDLCVCLAQ